MTKLAVGSWAFLFHQEYPTTDFHALIHHLMHLGYQGVELGAFAPHPHPDTFDTKEKRLKLRKLVAEHSLEFSALVPDFRGLKLWSVADPQPFYAAFEKNLTFADDLGIEMMRVDTVEPCPLAIGIEPKLLFERCVQAFATCARMAAERGITLCWEFQPDLPLHQPSEIIALIDAVRSLGHANFGALFDTGNAHRCAGNGLMDLLQKLKGKITHLHVSDGDATPVSLGKGVLDFDALVPDLLSCGVADDWWCVDLDGVPDGWTVAAESKRFLDKLRRKYSA